MLAQLARQLARAARQSGRERLFTRELAAPEMQAALVSLRNAVRNFPDREHAIIAAPDAQRDLVVTHVPGSENSVRLPERLLDGGERATFLHNHPLRLDTKTAEHVEFPLSLPDHMVAAAFPGRFETNGYGRMAQVSSVGRVVRDKIGSVARPTARMRKMDQKKLRDMLAQLLMQEANRQWGKRGIDVALDAEAANRALDRLGLIRYGARLSGDTANAMRSRDHEIMGVEDEIVRRLHPRVFGLPYPIRWSHIGAGAGVGAAAAGGAALGAHERKRR